MLSAPSPLQEAVFELGPVQAQAVGPAQRYMCDYGAALDCCCAHGCCTNSRWSGATAAFVGVQNAAVAISVAVLSLQAIAARRPLPDYATPFLHLMKKRNVCRTNLLMVPDIWPSTRMLDATRSSHWR
eukprot:TRINITY_DN25522_c0_g1_i1.p1 TRINITY_DN25522_c0_g1~~TRINITY_DN25522_c0_g1_i1.p1  ORF type:complete len:128 (+),score=6.37 TRINITY_DN25522_c0_g1_i1:353-736(+)